MATNLSEADLSGGDLNEAEENGNYCKGGLTMPKVTVGTLRKQKSP